MNQLKIPNGHQVVMPYLILPDAVKFFDFVKDVFGATETYRGITDDGRIMHGEINVGGTTIMYGQSGDQWTAQPAGLYIYSTNGDETFKKAIEKGASIVLEMEDKHYGRSGGVKDPFGNTWWITTVQ